MNCPFWSCEFYGKSCMATLKCEGGMLILVEEFCEHIQRDLEKLAALGVTKKPQLRKGGDVRVRK